MASFGVPATVTAFPAVDCTGVMPMDTLA